jgi:FAD/FMN-containing dehydrogenase
MRYSTIAAALLPFVAAQTIVVDDKTTEATNKTVAPAVAQVDATTSDAAVEYFPDETLQLTDDILANLTDLQLSNISLFSFDNTTLSKRGLRDGCKTYPGDLLWPSDLTWKVFNLLTGGALIKTTPYASPCYDDYGNYDAAKCAFLTNNWSNNSFLQTEDPTAINSILFQGATCVPQEYALGAIGSGATKKCTLGGYPAYTVAATNVAQIQLAVNLARNLNLRLVIKNTGHDFGGKSTGAGALNIWTHKLKNVKFVQNYRDSTYSGPALKLGSGIQAYEAYAAAKQYGVTVVGGEGRSVGVTGGYIAGGGHSPLSSIYGMGADQALAYEVVTADGRFVTASRNVNTDLFWALSGGGGSTFGVVTSVTVRAYPKLPVTIMTWTLMTGPTISADQFWGAVRAYFASFPTIRPAGAYEYWSMVPLGSDAFLFTMQPFFFPNMTTAQAQKLVAPMFAQWEALGVNIEPTYQSFDNFYDAWDAGFPLESWGTGNIRQGSRLFPKKNWADASLFNQTFEAYKSVVEDGGFVVGVGVQAPLKAGNVANAVNPAWRDAYFHAILATIFDADADPATVRATGDKLTFDWVQRWRDVTPGSGAYLSESDYIEPNFTQSFWGSNYARLYQIKQQYDPLGVFYAQNAVGSENYKMSEYIFGNLPSQNSKLCRA